MPKYPTWRARLRASVAAACVFAIVIVVFSTESRLNATYATPLTVFQAVQLYAEALFWMVSVLSVTVAVYIGTRAGERE